MRVAKDCGYKLTLVTTNPNLKDFLEQRWKGKANKPDIRLIQVPDYIRSLPRLAMFPDELFA
jgi:hypothetical protein